MSKTVEYSRRLMREMTPELKYRLEKIARESKKTLGEIIVDFLKQGASTPSILGIGC